MRPTFLTLLRPTMLLVLTTGCTETPAVGGPANDPTMHVLGPSGGRIESEDGQFRLEIAEGALESPIQVSITEHPGPPNAVAKAYRVMTDRPVDLESALVSLAFDPQAVGMTDLGAPDVIMIGGADDAWSPPVRSWIDIESSRVVAPLEPTGFRALFEYSAMQNGNVVTVTAEVCDTCSEASLLCADMACPGELGPGNCWSCGLGVGADPWPFHEGYRACMNGLTMGMWQDAIVPLPCEWDCIKGSGTLLTYGAYMQAAFTAEAYGSYVACRSNCSPLEPDPLCTIEVDFELPEPGDDDDDDDDDDMQGTDTGGTDTGEPDADTGDTGPLNCDIITCNRFDYIEEVQECEGRCFKICNGVDYTYQVFPGSNTYQCRVDGEIVDEGPVACGPDFPSNGPEGYETICMFP